MALLFNMLSRLLIAFLPSSKCASISWLQSPSVVILEPKKLRVNLSFFFFLQPEEAHLKHLPRAGNCIQWRHSVPCTAVQGSTQVHALFSTLTLWVFLPKTPAWTHVKWGPQPTNGVSSHTQPQACIWVTCTKKKGWPSCLIHLLVTPPRTWFIPSFNNEWIDKEPSSASS